MDACQPAIEGGDASRDVRSVDWTRLLQAARWHRLSPLLWRRLRAEELDAAVPPSAQEEMRADTRDTAARALVRDGQLAKVLRALAQANIPAMMLKGAALVEAVYPDASLRPMDDIDLLVPVDSIREAQQAVEHIGFRPWGVAFGRDDDARLAANFHHYPLLSADGTVSVEIHQHVTLPTPHFDIGEYWTRAVPATSGPPHLLPSPEDLFFHVAIHFSEDRFARRPNALGQLADLSWIAHKWSLDWENLGERAIAYRESSRLFLALHALRRVLGGGPPEHLLERVRPPSYRDSFGERFLAQRVLRARPSMALEEFTRGNRRLLSGTGALEWFVKPDDSERPSLARLRMRQAAFRARKLVAAAPTPRQLVEDVLLTKWILRLRREGTDEGERS